MLDIDWNQSRITSVPMVSPPLTDGRTRLVFRVRAHFRPMHRLSGPGFDIGDFVFMRKQMLGIKARAEQQHSPGLAVA